MQRDDHYGLMHFNLMLNTKVSKLCNFCKNFTRKGKVAYISSTLERDTMKVCNYTDQLQ